MIEGAVVRFADEATADAQIVGGFDGPLKLHGPEFGIKQHRVCAALVGHYRVGTFALSGSSCVTCEDLSASGPDSWCLQRIICCVQ